MIAPNPVELARTLARQIAPRADEADRLGQLPEADVRALRESGYLKLSVPRDYGGDGLSLRDCIAAQLELAQGSASTALVAAMQLHVFGHERENRMWPEAIFEKMCCTAVNEGALFNSIASEPQLGSPSRGGLPDTALTPDGEGWRLNGHKNWCTGGKHLTQLLVRARLGDTSTLVIVPGASPGLRWQETWREALSLRASDSHDLHLENVYVPREAMLEYDSGHTANAWFLLTITAVYLGAGMAARNAVIQYALERTPSALGKPIATLPGIQRQIGEIDLSLQAACSLLMEAATEWGDGSDGDRVFPRIIAAKHLAIDAAITVADKAMRIAGGASISRGLPLERLFRDTRAGTMHPPSGDLALETVGRAAIDSIRM